MIKKKIQFIFREKENIPKTKTKQNKAETCILK